MIEFKKEKRVTKREYFEGLKDLIVNGYTEINEDALVDFLDKQIGLLDDKATKEAEKRAEKRAAEGNSITDAIREVLTDKAQTSIDIIAAIGNEELTPSMITARITPMVKTGEVKKTIVKVDKRKLVGYYI